MNCKYCGNVLTEDATICNRCGNTLSDTPTTVNTGAPHSPIPEGFQYDDASGWYYRSEIAQGENGTKVQLVTYYDADNQTYTQATYPIENGEKAVEPAIDAVAAHTQDTPVPEGYAYDDASGWYYRSEIAKNADGSRVQLVTYYDADNQTYTQATYPLESLSGAPESAQTSAGDVLENAQAQSKTAIPEGFTYDEASGWYCRSEFAIGKDGLQEQVVTYYNKNGTFVLRKDEQGFWGWYRMEKKKDGTFEYTLQKTMKLPKDLQQRNEWHKDDPTPSPTVEPTPTPKTTPTPTPTPSPEPEKPAVEVNNPAMDLIYDRIMPESSKAQISKEELDKKLVFGLTGKGKYTVIESGYIDLDKYSAYSQQHNPSLYASFSDSEDQVISKAMADMEQDFIGKTGTITIETNALPGFSYLDSQLKSPEKIHRTIDLSGTPVKLSLGLTDADYHITGKDPKDWLLLESTFVYCAVTMEEDPGQKFAAYRFYAYFNTDGSIDLKGYYAQINADTSFYVASFECTVTDSNISA